MIPFHGFSMYGEFILHLFTFSSHTKLVEGTLQEQDITSRVCVRFSPTVAPLCFLYNEPSKLYSVFREMYIRYFFRLHSISSSPSVRSLVFVCDCFVCVFTSVHLIHMCFLAGDRVFVPAVWAAAPDPPAAALLPPPTDRGAAVSTHRFIPVSLGSCASHK